MGWWETPFIRDSVNMIMQVVEIVSSQHTQANSLEKSRLNALQYGADAAKKRLDAEKQRQRVQKAQRALQKALHPKTP
jgi:hypothetical protein